MQRRPTTRLQKAIPSALFGFIAGALLVATANMVYLVLLWGVGPTIVGSILLASVSCGAKLNRWKAIGALLVSIPAYLLAFFIFAATTSFAQAHVRHPSSVISDLGADTLFGFTAAALTGCLEMELISWLLSGYLSARHTLLLAVVGFVMPGIAYCFRGLTHEMLHTSTNPVQLWLFFGPLFAVGGSLVVAIVGDQMRYQRNIIT